MAKTSLRKQWGRYSAVAPTFSEGEAGAVQVDQNGAMKVSSDIPTGTGSPSETKYGQPGRYTGNAVVLKDGQMTSLLYDKNGNVIIA